MDSLQVLLADQFEDWTRENFLGGTKESRCFKLNKTKTYLIYENRLEQHSLFVNKTIYWDHLSEIRKEGNTYTFISRIFPSGNDVKNSAHVAKVDQIKIECVVGVPVFQEFVRFLNRCFSPFLIDMREINAENADNLVISRIAMLFSNLIYADEDDYVLERDVAVDYLLKRFYGNNAFWKLNAIQLFKRYHYGRRYDFRRCCFDIISSPIFDYEKRLELMNQLYRCASLSDDINRLEQNCLHDISRYLLLEKKDIDELKNRYDCV